jgi:hypothetical protein
MEILDLKFAGISVSTWLLLLGAYLFCKFAHKQFLDWKERRAWEKQYDAKKQIWDERHRWELRSLMEWTAANGLGRTANRSMMTTGNPVEGLLERLNSREERRRLLHATYTQPNGELLNKNNG